MTALSSPRDSLQPTLSRIIDWCLSLIQRCIFKRLALHRARPRSLSLCVMRTLFMCVLVVYTSLTSTLPTFSIRIPYF
jgi:hypothetical protein